MCREGCPEGSIDGNGNLALWHLTIGFETVEGSNWSKAKLQKVLVDGKLNKMELLMSLLNLEELPARPKVPPLSPDRRRNLSIDNLDTTSITQPTSPARTGEQNASSMGIGSPQSKKLAQTPTKSRQLNRLRQMGFKEDEHELLRLLDKYNDSIEGVLGELLA